MRSLNANMLVIDKYVNKAAKNDTKPMIQFGADTAECAVHICSTSAYAAEMWRAAGKFDRVLCVPLHIRYVGTEKHNYRLFGGSGRAWLNSTHTHTLNCKRL